MPELPDLELFKESLGARILNKKIIEAEIVTPCRNNFSEKKLQSIADNAAVQEIVREGKELHFRFDAENVLAVHLMLHGGFAFGKQIDPELPTKIRFSFDTGEQLAMLDPQSWISFTLNPAPKSSSDVLSDKFTLNHWQRILQKNASKQIKEILLDQRLLRGIGNAYADEIAYDAKVHPASIAGRLPAPKIDAIFNSIRHVLVDAIKTLKKNHSGALSGENREFLKVHTTVRHTTDSGFEIKTQRIAGRKTYFSDEQKLY